MVRTVLQYGHTVGTELLQATTLELETHGGGTIAQIAHPVLFWVKYDK